MPTDLTNIVSSLGLVSETLGSGESTPVDKSEKPKPKAPEDPCINEETSPGEIGAARTGREIFEEINDQYNNIASI